MVLMIVASVTIYLIIGAMIGLKDSELIEESFEETKEVYKHEGGFRKSEQVMAILIIIVIAPVIEVIAGIRNLIH